MNRVLKLLRRAAPLLCAVGFFGANAFASDNTLVERGRYLAVAGDCSGCHTAKGRPPFSGGQEIATPFGTVISPNITPDTETGIGGWTSDQFVASVQRGQSPHGKRLYPAMPYPYFAGASRDDMLAIFAYLKSLPPTHNAVRSNRLPFPLNQRILMVGWNLLFFRPETFHPDGAKSADWNRGAYLTRTLGHCGACHTPKNVLGADEKDHALQGAVLQNWYAENLTEDQRNGLGQWSNEEIAAYLKNGHNQRADAGGTMAEVIADSTSLLRDDDTRAIAAYLKGVPPHSAALPSPPSPDSLVMQTGHTLFIDNCAACHGMDGQGTPQLFSRLTHSSTVQADNPTGIIREVLEGVQSVATDPNPTAAAMPPFAWKFDDAQITAVLTYVRNSWGNAATNISQSEVAKLRRTLADAKR